MKKLLPGILATLLCLGCFTACDQLDSLKSKLPDFLQFGKTESTEDSKKDEDSTPQETHPHEKDLKDAKDFINGQMQEMTLDTRKGYEVVNSFSFIGSDEVYDVAWSVNIDGVTVEEGEENDTIVISEMEEDTPYVLTCTITDPQGCHTVSFSYDATALKAVVPTFITEKPAENTAYKLYV
ncbi:MAG: hypothetical protein IJ284_03905, partial [Clostridia bacterium]|nr:hypothetical protein [Clostridia bacterium]